MFLQRKQPRYNNLFNLNDDDNDEDILDELQNKPQEMAQTSGQLLDAEFIDEDFMNTRHFSVSNKVAK